MGFIRILQFLMRCACVFIYSSSVNDLSSLGTCWIWSLLQEPWVWGKHYTHIHTHAHRHAHSCLGAIWSSQFSCMFLDGWKKPEATQTGTRRTCTEHSAFLTKLHSERKKKRVLGEDQLSLLKGTVVLILMCFQQSVFLMSKLAMSQSTLVQQSSYCEVKGYKKKPDLTCLTSRKKTAFNIKALCYTLGETN